MADQYESTGAHAQDLETFHSMGYAQELSRRMGGFQNFAISFSILCILAGGITAFPLSLSAAGGIYHWASLLGGRGDGWVAAWTTAGFLDSGWWIQTIFIAAITAVQALLNHYGIRATTVLTDFSGYLIFVVALVLTLGLLAYAPSLDFSRLFTFGNFSGEPGGSVWPTAMQSTAMVFMLGLLQGVCTVTGFDASAHTAEETRDAARAAPKGMLQSVFWSFLFGYMVHLVGRDPGGDLGALR